MRIRLGLEWFLNPDHVPFLLAERMGWFREAGLEVELVEPAQHLDAAEEIAAGRMEVAITEPLHLIEDASRGRAVRGFARFLHTNGGVMYLQGRGIERPRDMAGCRIQYPGAPGPGGPAILATMIEADGGEADLSAFGRVNRGFHHTDALAEGDADVATLAFYNFEVIEARHRGLNPGFFALRDWGVPDFCQLVLFTTPELLEERADALKALVGCVRRGIDLLRQQPEVAREAWYAHTGQDPEEPLGRAIFEATVPCFVHDFSMSDRYWERLAGWMHQRGLAPRTVLADEVWTDALAFA
jgi:ABC-type nitrate/sulfonate/bicarbonate transport system substrate-binding protein